jgi:hypothetical protein
MLLRPDAGNTYMLGISTSLGKVKYALSPFLDGLGAAPAMNWNELQTTTVAE